MLVESIKLENFRNYGSLELEFDPGTNLFYGDNAQGKTNILEAVYLCGTTRSHKGSKDREMIHFDRDEAHICMRIRKGDVPYRIDMHLKKSKTKGIAINGVPVRKAGELIGLGNFVFFSPEDLNIIKNGPGERRRFLDMELCQLDSIYLFHLSNYNKLLLQRNRLLKDYGFYPESGTMLDVIDEQLIQYGTALIRSRRVFTDQLQEIIGGIHSSLSGRKEDLTVTYEPNAEETEFGQKLQEKAGRGLFVALLLFVGIPLPGTGAWTGTLAASLLDMDFKSSVIAVMCGVVLAGVIMGLLSMGVFGALGTIF